MKTDSTHHLIPLSIRNVGHAFFGIIRISGLITPNSGTRDVCVLSIDVPSDTVGDVCGGGWGKDIIDQAADCSAQVSPEQTQEDRWRLTIHCCLST